MTPSIGRAVNRKEDRRLVTGQGRFVSGLELPRMLHLAFLRSPLAHARIAGVETAAAERLSGVRAVFTGPQFSHVVLRARSALPTYIETDQPVLAHEKVRFAGEPLALVAARDRATAEDACELIDVEYEPLPVTVGATTKPEEPVHAAAADNVLLERRFEAGDVEAALSRAALVVRRELNTNRHAGNPLECRATAAVWDGGGARLTCWSGTQVPHLLRNALAQLLDVPEGSVRVVAPDVGGGFGVKAMVYPEEVAICLAARALPNTPLKWVEDRAEHLLAAAHAREHRYLLRAGFSADGELLALDAEIVCNAGAYSLYPWTAGIEPLMAGGLLTGPYRLEHYRCVVRGVATNTAPAGPYRGVARPASTLAMELVLDAAARRLGLGPDDIRRRNLIRPHDVPYTLPTRLVDDSGQYERCLDRALRAVDYDGLRAERARRREAGEKPLGIGIACYNELTGLGRAASAGPRMPFRTGHDACTVRVDPDGRLTVFSGVASQGQGLETTVAQIVSDCVGVRYEDVEVRIGDTESSLWGFGAFSSRQAVIGGGAACRAAAAVREQILRLAAGLLEASEADLELEDGVVRVAGSPGRALALREIASVAYLETQRLPEGIEPGLEATSFYDPIRGAFAAGSQAAAVEVDPATGAVEIVKWVCVEDAGTIVNPRIVDGQITGAVAQGIGGALYEHHVYDENGTLLSGTLADYLLPTSAEVPELVVEHLSEPADNPLGVRGVGEGGTLGPAAVLAGAIEDALGVELDRLPLTPERVWELAR